MHLLVCYNAPLWKAFGLALLVYGGSVKLCADQQGSSEHPTPQEALPLEKPSEEPQEARQEVTPPSPWSSLAFWILFHSVQATLLLLFVDLFGEQGSGLTHTRSCLRKGLPGVVFWQVIAKAYLTLAGPAPPLHVAQADAGFKGVTSLFFCLPFLVYLWGAWTGFLMAPKRYPWPYGDAAQGIDYLLIYLVLSLFTPFVYAAMRASKAPHQAEERPASTPEPVASSQDLLV